MNKHVAIITVKDYSILLYDLFMYVHTLICAGKISTYVYLCAGEKLLGVYGALESLAKRLLNEPSGVICRLFIP